MNFRLFGNGALIFLFLFLVSCSNTDLSIKEECDQFDNEQAQEFILSGIKVCDSLVLKTSPKLGGINVNIPPKEVKGKLYLLTEKNYILKYRMENSRICEYEVFGYLPHVYEKISDYFILNDSTVWFCCNDGLSPIIQVDFKNGSYSKLLPQDTTLCQSMPFLGLTMQKVNDKLIFPMVDVYDGNEKSNFLAVYNRKGHYAYGLGSFRAYGEKNFAPYYDSPIMTTIVDNHFYVTSSSSNGVIECMLDFKDGKTELIKKEKICFSKQCFNLFREKLSKQDLGDFGKIEKSYIEDSYTVGLYKCGNDLIRISKKPQPLVNTKTGMKNVLMNSPWTMEIYSLPNHRGRMMEISAEQFGFMNALVLKNKFYVLSNQSKENEIKYYALR